MNGTPNAPVCRTALVGFTIVLSLLTLGRLCQGADLSQVLHRIERRAPSLMAAEADSEARRAAVGQVRSGLWGEVDAFVNADHFDDGRLVAPISFPLDVSAQSFDNNQAGFGFSGRLALDVNGRIGALIRSVQGEFSASRAQAANERLRLLHLGARLYRGLELVSGERQALEQQMEALGKHVDVASARIRLGRAASVERLRLSAELESVRGRIANLDGTEIGLRSQLASLLLESYDDAVPVPTREPPPLENVASPIDDRPDLIQSRALIAAAAERLRAARADRLPALGLTGRWERNQGFNNGEGSFWQVGIRLQVPLWDGTRRRSTVGIEVKRHLAAKHRLEALRRLALAEVASARGAWDAGRASHAAAEAALRAAVETARIDSIRFQEGRLSSTDLVDSEAALAQTRCNLAASLVRWLRADDDLHRATGLPPADY